MNSYPPELLAQLAPVMFAAGLDAFTAPTDQPSSPTASRADDFSLLAARLREAFKAQRKVAIWQPEKTKTFQVILVDRETRFPPRKLVPPEDPLYSSAHSPLSPLTPTSPLHPDGLIAPIWIRKHTSLVPSVFVLFLRIFEFPSSDSTTSPLDLLDTNRDREQEERKTDTELAAEIALRKKSTNERGLKLTVVLMATRKMLDDPALDNRLTFIRRQSGLDSRAALFVLSPVSPNELSEFVKSLQQALYEPALEYYTTHSKRVRRKRNRHSQTTTYPNLAPSNIPRPLRPEGWTVRYEYKMACFAEFRGEDEVALKHYQDAYNTLIVMFGSPVILPPRTKRWAEAKVLADCIDIKISKLYLYNNEHALALTHHNNHVRVFSDLSRGWGIGEETFEYWSWIARQHRVFAELLDQGTRSTLNIPVHKPLHATSHNQNANVRSSATNSFETDSGRSMGINASQALQHPGVYYFMAAKCTERRRERFLKTLEQENTQNAFNASPGFTNEKKVDHVTIILELYTKAYELFKKYTSVDSQSATQSRLTLWIAHQIARTYFENTQFDMAIRFFERIAKTYRREKWSLLLRPLLSAWYTCAREVGDVELGIRILIEMLGHDLSKNEIPASVEEDLVALLKSSTPSSDETLVVDLPESQPIFDSNVVFWASEVEVGEPSAFQLTLIAPGGVPISSLPITTLNIHFSHRASPIVIRHRTSKSPEPSSFQLVNIGHISSLEGTTEDVHANLCWEIGGCFIFHGTISSDVPISLKVTKLVLLIEEGSWKVEIPFDPCNYRHGLPPVPRWLSAVEPQHYLLIEREGSSFVNVRHREHNLTLSLIYEPTAYLNEEFPITINVTNADTRSLGVVVDVLLPPLEIDGAENTILLDKESSSNFIKGVPLGVLDPGVSSMKTLYLMSTGASGSRVVDISIQSRPINTSFESAEADLQDMTEILETLVIPTVDPIESSQSITYSKNLDDWPGLASLDTFGEEGWSDKMNHEAIVRTRIVFASSSALQVVSMSLVRQDHTRAKIVECSADGAVGRLPSDCYPGDEIVHMCRAYLIPPEEDDGENYVRGIGNYHIKWRRMYENGDIGTLSTTVVPLPPLQAPIDSLLALLSVPSAATLHVPFSLMLTVRNYHASRSANVVVQLELDASDGFVVAGLRSGRVSILMPGEEEKLIWRLTAIECGHVRIPKIKVVDKRPTFTDGTTEPSTESINVNIVDVRVYQVDMPNLEEPKAGTILVLPH